MARSPPPLFSANTFKNPLNWLKLTKKNGRPPLFSDPGSATAAYVGNSKGGNIEYRKAVHGKHTK